MSQPYLFETVHVSKVDHVKDSQETQRAPGLRQSSTPGLGPGRSGEECSSPSLRAASPGGSDLALQTLQGEEPVPFLLRGSDLRGWRDCMPSGERGTSALRVGAPLPQEWQAFYASYFCTYLADLGGNLCQPSD